jgi:hypothetical protein
LNRPLFLLGEDILCLRILERIAAVVVPHLDARSLPEAGGRSFLEKSIRPFAESGQRLLVLGDSDGNCPVTVRRKLEPRRKEGIEVRIAVREADAWLLGDPGIADALQAPRHKLPSKPETILDAKEELIQFASRSRSVLIRREMMRRFPTQSQPPGYNRIIPEFVRTHWDPIAAAERCESLGRCLRRIESTFGS